MEKLVSFVIEDDLSTQTKRAIEVALKMVDGTTRWCFFMRPEALATCGDWVDGTKVRFHYGAPHMIVLGNELTEEMIERALRHIDKRGELEQCSLPLNQEHNI